MRPDRVDGARHHRVDGDAEASDLDGERATQPDDTELGADTMRPPRLAEIGVSAADIDDAPPASLHHAGQHRLAEEKRRPKIGGEDSIPIRDSDLGYFL